MARTHSGDEEHRAAFGANAAIHEEITRLKNNDPRSPTFGGDALHGHYDVGDFSNLAWKLLGRYIAHNDHLYHLHLAGLHLVDGNLSLLCRTMIRSRSLKTLDLGNNDLGLGGIQSLVRFLQDSPNLTRLSFAHNRDINAECFGVIVGALDGGPIEKLGFENRNIDHITALGRCTLSHLKMLDIGMNAIDTIPSLEKYTNLETLWLGRNTVGKGGCGGIAKLLSSNGSSLRRLHLGSNAIGEEEAILLATAPEHNTSLVELQLHRNEFKEKGCRAFLILLNSVASVGSAYNSNHFLTALGLPFANCGDCTVLKEHVTCAIKTNKKHRGNVHAAGRAKVIATQLHSGARRELCHLQGIAYSYGSLFAETDPGLLPRMLRVTGEEHGQTEVFRMLVASAPDIASATDKTRCDQRNE